jgi:uncharacterized BrkB/YihY/UPF0761 family membrane protein
MIKKRKLMLIAGAVLSLPISVYAGVSSVFYAWLNASNPEKWPEVKAAIWSYSSLAISAIFLFLFFYCVVKLIKESNRKRREKSHAT